MVSHSLFLTGDEHAQLTALGMEEDAQAIEQAVNAALDSGVKTRDMKGNTSTREMGDQIRSHLTRILDAKK